MRGGVPGCTAEHFSVKENDCAGLEAGAGGGGGNVHICHA